MKHMKTVHLAGIVLALVTAPVWAETASPVFKTVAATGDDPAAAGKKAAAELKAAFGATPIKAVL